jgi:D-alanyl-D-alanine carboxypeptidase/D-alanyl-D-alanine-endopeptidase (penicillin-binding protein 4)
MKQAVRLGCLLIAALTQVSRADLASDVDAVLRDKLLVKATVGIKVVRLGKSDADSKEVFQIAGRAQLTPASNLKLTTTSAALDRFGPDFKFQTILLQHGDDLILVGDGDPSFGDAEYLKRVGWKPTTVYENWASQLKKLNVRSVRNVLIDDSVFDETYLHPNWPANQIDHWYVAEVGGVNFDANCIGFIIQPTATGRRVEFSLAPNTRYVLVDNQCVTGQNEVQLGRKPGTNEVLLRGEAPASGPSSLQETIHDPPMYAATVFAETIAASGIPVTGAVARDRTVTQQRQKAPGDWKVVSIHETPLSIALARANKDSINLYAESLCKRLGHESSHASGSWENGTAAVGAFLKKAGVSESEFDLDDGSGLSKKNHISPGALVRVLTYDFFSPNRDAFLNSLSITGVDGTLEDRFRGTDLRRRVIGKSGFVEGVSCLSGFLKARDGQWYAFSIMMNGIPYKSNSLAKALQEKIVRALDVHSTTLSAQR